MAGLLQRLQDWRNGPTKRELADKIAHLEAIQRRFPQLGKNQAIAAGTEIGYGEFQYDPNSALHGAAKYDIYDQMESDPHVKGVLLDRVMPLVTAEWEIKAASDKPKDIEVAEFCAANLLRDQSDRFGSEYWIQTPWKAQRLPEILSMLSDGFALFVASWRRVGTKVIYDRLQWVEPATIDGTEPWEIDDEDNIIAVNRKLTTPQQNFLMDERIEAERLRLYVWDIKGARYEGRSFIRAMYGAWYRKDFIQRMAVIWAQKVGAPVPVGYYPNGWKQTEINRFKQFIMSLRGRSAAEAFGMFPLGTDGNPAQVNYAGAETGEVDRMRGLIQGENQEIHQGGRDSSAMLGETMTGSRALGDSKSKGEIKTTQAIAETLCAWENHGVANLKGTLQTLVDKNYTVTAYPELVCSKIDPYQNFDETLQSWKAGIVPKTPESRRQICEGTLGLNLPDDAYEVEEPPPMVPQVPQEENKDGGLSPDGEPEEDTETLPRAASLESVESFRKRIAPLLQPTQEGRPKGGGFRFPNRLELEIVNLAAVGGAYRVGEADLRTAFRGIKRAMIGDLMQRLRSGKVTTRNIESQRRSAFRGRKKAHAALLAEVKQVGEVGMEHVTAELKKQGV